MSDCEECTNVCYASDSRTCSDSWFLSDCGNCHHCVGCVGLRNQSYCWLNQSLSKTLYEQQLGMLEQNLSYRSTVQLEFEKLCASIPQPWSRQRMCENVSGDYLVESKNCFNCFEAVQCEDCRHCQSILNTKNSQDVTYFGRSGELLYQCNNVGINAYHVLFSSYAYSSEVFYCYNVHYSKECFGCVNLHHKQYCILNKQYRPQEYAALLKRIVAHMRSTGEWGEFFPAWFSPFEYNETLAQEYFPLEQTHALKLGYRWRPTNTAESDTTVRSDTFLTGGDFPRDWENCLNVPLKCQESKKNFKLSRPEVNFYKVHHLPLP